jgi:hypothetical protein
MPPIPGVCRDYMADRCFYGEDCKFIHDPDLCFDWWRSGGKDCSHGSSCEYNHFVAGTKDRETGSTHPPSAGKGGKPKALGSQPANQPSHPPPKVFETAKGGANGKRVGYGARNTESFEPSHEPSAMRVIVDATTDRYKTPIQVRDVGMYPSVFSRPGDTDIYKRLVGEIEKCSIPQKDLLLSWHGDTHWIADDSTGWKKQCPTFTMVVDRLRQYFNMDIKATRFNWYKDQSEWKPFHHDAAAVKPDKAKTQNFTVAVSFGCTRDAAFEEVKSKTVISMPQPDGFVYTFARDVNIMWKHGILQVPPEKQRPEGRISIIAWGWVDQEEV